CSVPLAASARFPADRRLRIQRPCIIAERGCWVVNKNQQREPLGTDSLPLARVFGTDGIRRIHHGEQIVTDRLRVLARVCIGACTEGEAAEALGVSLAEVQRLQSAVSGQRVTLVPIGSIS